MEASISRTTNFCPKFIPMIPKECRTMGFSYLEYFRAQFYSLTDIKYCLFQVTLEVYIVTGLHLGTKHFSDGPLFKNPYHLITAPYNVNPLALNTNYKHHSKNILSSFMNFPLLQMLPVWTLIINIIAIFSDLGHVYHHLKDLFSLS